MGDPPPRAPRGLSHTPTPFLRQDLPSPFQVRTPLGHGGSALPCAPTDGYMDHSGEAMIPLSSPDNHSKFQPRLASAQLTKLWKIGGPLSERIRCCSFVAAKAAGARTPISLDLALEQCRARARSQPHMLEPTATAGGDGGLGKGVCVAGPLPGATNDSTQRRPWGTAPGCFETGAGLIKARFCNGCSKFGLTASTVQSSRPWTLVGLGNSGNGGSPCWGSRADGAQSQRRNQTATESGHHDEAPHHKGAGEPEEEGNSDNQLDCQATAAEPDSRHGDSAVAPAGGTVANSSWETTSRSSRTEWE